jgi:hypothetical protein
MKRLLDGSVYSVLLLVVLSACGPATPTAQPTAAGGCNQTGCPYPAICEATTGLCVINQPQGPGAAAPQAPGAGIVQNNPGQSVSVAPTATEMPTSMPPAAKSPGGVSGLAANPGNPGPGSLIPACTPPTSSLTQVTPFCNDKAAGLGGVTVDLQASDVGWWGGNDNVVCKTQTPASGGITFTCSGPQKASFKIMGCGSCGTPLQAGAAALGNYTCSNGYVKQTAGNCIAGPATSPYAICPTGSHYDGTQQYCVDDVTAQKLADLCPAGTVAYYPEYHFCMTQSYPAAFDCQTFTVQLGECLTGKKPAGAGPCPAGQSLQVDPLNGGYVCK